MMPSIRRRLLVLLLSVIGAVWCLVAANTYFEARHEVQELFDANLAQSARLLSRLTAHELAIIGRAGAQRLGSMLSADIEEADTAPAHPYEKKIAFQAWDSAGRLMYRTASTPRDTEPAADGFSDATVDGYRWRFFQIRGPELTVQVAQRYDVRQELITQIAMNAVLPVLIGLPVMGVAIWLAVGRGLVPLQRLRARVNRLEPDNLEPLGTSDVPSEVVPLVESLNALLARLRDALHNERRFTADAAHELRTPLAALRTQAQVALRAGDAASRQHALERIVEGADRATHLVDQLLTLARCDAAQPDAGTDTTDLSAIARTILQEVSVAALARGVDLELRCGQAPRARGQEGMIGVMLRNLVDNAIRYSPDDALVVVSTGETKGRPWLAVSDNGPGIPPRERERVFRRFYRGMQASGSGSGLGLSIVGRIGELLGAEVHLAGGEGNRGLTVEVAFQPAPRSPGPASQLREATAG